MRFSIISMKDFKALVKEVDSILPAESAPILAKQI
jgi:hypothetical protein